MKPETNQVFQNLRVLVVDDHMMMRSMVSQSLRSLGFTQVQVVTGGQEAWDEIKARSEINMPYHIVFLDWHMPEMNGMEVLRRCRENKRYDRLAIVMLTAEQEEKNILLAIESGATSYLVKPVSKLAMNKNLEKVIAWLAKKGVVIDKMEKKTAASAKEKDNFISQQLQLELKPVVAKGIENIFSELFDVEISTDDNSDSSKSKDMVCLGRLSQKDVTIMLRFFFDRDLLKPLLRQLYAPKFLEDPVVYEDAACEIVNILCAQIKAFLNGHGYSLALDFPAMGSQEEKCKDAHSIMDIKFSLNNEQYFLVDVAANRK